MRPTSLRSIARCAFAAFLTAALALPAHAATITIVNLDGASEGFNDPTPATPVGGNPGTTIGAQRLYVFQYAANIWGSILTSPVEILVEANFDPLDCDGSSAVLGSAGPNTLHSDFDNAAHTLTWYHQALANRLQGSDLDPETADIGATFNSDLGKPECFPQPWYYGVDGNEGVQIELLPVVLHELGHGLGFSTSTIAGVQEVFPHIYDYFLYDNTQGLHWPDMTEPERAASAQNCSNVVWDGPSVTSQAPDFLGAKPLLRVNSPAVAAGDREIGLASFGPTLDVTGVTGNLVLVNDGSGVPTNGCEALLNAAQVAGNIAFVDRGGCPFVQKVLNAQNAGAIGVVVADSMAGCPALGMGGADPTITIPAVRLTQDDGAQIKAHTLLGTVNATMRVDPALKAGADANGHVMVFTPAPYQLGSSVSHWDISASPDLLMEPALNQGLSSGIDLTRAQFADIGWFQGQLAAGPSAQNRRLEPSFPNPTSGPATIRYALPREERVELTIYDLGGRKVASLVDARMPQGPHSVTWDGTDLRGAAVPAGVYQYRLKSASIEEGRHLVIVR